MEKKNEAWVKSMLETMSDRQKTGQLIMATTIWDERNGFGADAYDPAPVSQLEHMQTMIQQYHAGSVIIYNWSRAGTMTRFNNQLQQWALEMDPGIPLFISADLEYGLAQRLPYEATVFPRQMGIGAAGKEDFAWEQGRITALEGLATGFNWSYSPVADVNVSPQNPVIGVRAFGEQTEEVSRLTAAMVRGSQEHGMIATPKHFPGHGDTDFDSHYDLSMVSYDMETLRKIHLPPFQAAIDAGADAIMTAHVVIEALDPSLPATLSEKVLTGLLRQEMGFEGIVVTDAMSMDAIDDYWGAGEAAVMAILAGADIIMATGTPGQQAETFEALYSAVQEGVISKERLEESVGRILRTKAKYGLDRFKMPDPAKALVVAGHEDHRQKAREIAVASMTLVRNEGILPFDPNDGSTTLVAGVAYVPELTGIVENRSSGAVLSWQYGRLPADINPTKTAVEEAMALARNANRIIAFTYSYSSLKEGQRALVEAFAATGKPMAVVSLGLPYDLLSFPDVPAYLATYSLDRWPHATPTPVVWDAVIDVLFGLEQPGGRLPVSIGEDWPLGYGLDYP